MRWQLLWNPGLAFERLANISRQRRRLVKLRGTPAQGLSVGHIESLELLEAARPHGIETIYDIGANVGTWTLLAKAVIPGALVEAFEPLPRHRAEFERRLRALNGVTCHATALGAENMNAVLRVTDFSDASSLLLLAPASRTEFGVAEVETVEVSVRRLDDYQQEHSLPLPDLIKLDVQGYELEVLKGAPQSLAHAKAVICEVCFKEYYQGQCRFHELVQLLADAGLFLATLGESTARAAELRQADVLFLREGLSEQ